MLNLSVDSLAQNYNLNKKIRKSLCKHIIILKKIQNHDTKVLIEILDNAC